jgi:glycosyltransferase involved in cell wall biosynthesis
VSEGATADARRAEGTDARAALPRPLLVLATSAGGVGRHVHSMAAGLVTAGLDVMVAGPASTDQSFGFSQLRGVNFTAVEIGPTPAPIEDGRAVAALRGPTLAADVVHAHGLRAGLIAGLAAPRRTPLVVTWHNAMLGGGVRRRMLGLLERYVARRADVMLGVSGDLVERARRLGSPDARLGPVAAPGLSPPARPRAEMRADLDAGDRPVVLTVGRVTEQKDYPTLLSAAAVLGRRDPAPLVIVAGGGPDLPALQGRVDAERLPVRLLGARDDIADLLAAADVFVSTSTWEGRALVIQEAARAGVPVVATAVGGTPELMGDAALLVPTGDPAAVADAVARVLDDPALGRELSARGRRQAAGWPDVDDTVAAVRALYAELTGR